MIKSIKVYYVFISLGFKVYIVNRLRTMHLIRELKYILGDNKNQLSANLTKRIHFYTIQSCLAVSWFSSLRGYKATRSERQKALYLGAITPILDDLNDKMQLPYHKILEKTNKGLANSSESLVIFNYLYEKLFKDDKHPINSVLQDIALAQDESIRQILPGRLTQDELTKITQEKGGKATLFYRMILDNELVPCEKDAIFTLGYLLQLINDMFDVYKDYHNNQQTLFTNTDNLNDLEVRYEELYNNMVMQFVKLSYKPENIKRCLAEINIIVARGMVCLNQLLKLQKSSGDRFSIGQYERYQLICNMEKLSSILCMFRYSFLIFNKIHV
ncbi:MAG: hypothetical protein JXB49_01680 [Bacteroidales bacterium]|nr:hypothetical protein [Bacteroidales bacterium]